jgi:glutamyl-Q tRNA(Asp) synthetase
MTDSTYIGRFAPSPTGPLHFGSTVAAVASYLQARSQRGAWYVRVEDIDPPREHPGAADAILRVIEACGLEWDGPVVYQSTRLGRYREVLAGLSAAGMTYPCACSRREIGGAIYPGTCRAGIAEGRTARSTRLKVPARTIRFTDRIRGPVEQNLRREVGDFIVIRGDGLIAYHIAVAVDDAWQSVTEIVRGVDLIDATPRQIFLQEALALAQPRYVHLPVVLNDRGNKLSKQTHAKAVTAATAAGAVFEALRFLNHPPPNELLGAPAPAILGWALDEWDVAKVGRVSHAHTPAPGHDFQI